MRKIVIIMTLYNRKELADNTIGSILRYANPTIHILVVDDGSDVKYTYDDERVTVIYNSKRKKNTVTQGIAYNMGISYAINRLNADIIVLQNAEAYHYGNILTDVTNRLTEDNYISYACLSVTENMLPITDEKILPYANIGVAAAGDIELGWYNHSHWYPRYFDFCSAITVSNIKKLNGFDERFVTHAWYCDDNFYMRVRRLGLKPEIVDEPFVVHQWHSRSHQPFGFKPESLALYHKTIKEETFRAERKITEQEWEI